MVPFGGWEMPLHYGSQIEEHLKTRAEATIFDVSHMGQIEVNGARALDLIQEIVTRDISRLEDGQEAYCVMCHEDGGLIDDLIVTRLGEGRYFIVVNASPYEKDSAFMRTIADRLSLPGVQLRPCAEEWAMIALQGPRWAEIGRKVLGGGAFWDLAAYRAAEMKRDGADLIFSTTGYTGERGVELICRPEKATALWSALLAAGARPAGLAARDTLRLEKGMCLSGQDFTEANNPFEARLGWVVDLKKTSFSGRASLERIHKEGPKQRLVGLLPEGRRFARHGAKIFRAGEPIGEITSGGYSPSLERPIAMGYVGAEAAKAGGEVEIDLGRGTTKAVMTSPPFYPKK